MLLATANPLNASELIFPTLEVLHIAGFAVLVGTIAMVDFRLLGLGLKRQKVSEVARDLGPWIVFHYTVHRRITLSEANGFGTKAVACTSLALWVGIVFGGIFIAFD